MKLAIIVSDNIVGIDGEFRSVTLPNMGNVRAIQWLHTSGTIEYTNNPNEKITSIAPYQAIIDSWNLLNPPVVNTTFSALKALKEQSIKNSCEANILSGFSSTALGTLHTYPSNDRDQVNLSGTIQKSLLPSSLITDYYLFLCVNSNGEWAYRAHIAAQIQQVGIDAYNNILNARIKNATLQYQIMQAINQSELDLIVW